ncbi:hypothetical protein E2C01_094991 [Portunus trituberculatus]|uniref:Uncharacterized protein n=1 Tax=Portunus trituberculatus TaxID=210409 RepID=A0A5B7K354_PORTR|nr:hypothetical protein [Portunus trituberculatus]
MRRSGQSQPSMVLMMIIEH